MFITFSASLIQAQEFTPINETIPENIRDEFKSKLSGTKSKSGRIAFGKTPYPGQFPYMALLNIRTNYKYQSVMSCGGTLVSSNFILSAASCLQSVRAIDIWMGSNDRNTLTIHRNGIGYVNNPLYKSIGSENSEHDISIIRLQYPVALTPVQLPKKCSICDSFEGVLMITAGWGGTTNLMYTQVTGAPISQCGSIRSDKFICAKGLENSGNVLGDNGGPLLSANTIIGVVSFQYGYGSNKYNGYTRVDRYLDWVSLFTGLAIQ